MFMDGKKKLHLLATCSYAMENIKAVIAYQGSNMSIHIIVQS